MSNDEEQYNTLSRLPRFRRDKRKTKKKSIKQYYER